jgi:hypothetical protein
VLLFYLFTSGEMMKAKRSLKLMDAIKIIFFIISCLSSCVWGLIKFSQMLDGMQSQIAQQQILISAQQDRVDRFIEDQKGIDDQLQNQIIKLYQKK